MRRAHSGRQKQPDQQWRWQNLNLVSRPSAWFMNEVRKRIQYAGHFEGLAGTRFAHTHAIKNDPQRFMIRDSVFGSVLPLSNFLYRTTIFYRVRSSWCRKCARRGAVKNTGRFCIAAGVFNFLLIDAPLKCQVVYAPCRAMKFIMEDSIQDANENSNSVQKEREGEEKGLVFIKKTGVAWRTAWWGWRIVETRIDILTVISVFWWLAAGFVCFSIACHVEFGF